MKRKLHKNVWILVAVLGIVWGHAAAIPAAVDSGMDITTPPVVAGRQLIQEKIDFLMATLQERLEQLPETERPALFVGEEFSKASGLNQLYEAILDPGHPLYDAVRKAGRLSQDAQARPALADDANLYLNLAILETLDELLTNPSLADEIRNTVFALIDLLKELEVPEAYQAPDTRFGFTGIGRPNFMDRIERANFGEEESMDDESSGFLFYGKAYDLDSDVTVYNDGLIVFGATPTDGSLQLASTYGLTEEGFPFSGLNLETNMPAMLGPLVSVPGSGYVTNSIGDVEKTELRYTYRWHTQYEQPFEYEMTPRFATACISVIPMERYTMESSASLYANDWIVFNYETQAGSGAPPFMSIPGIAGLSPGDGSEGSGHPGEGEDRNWISGADFSPPADIEKEYTAIYNGYGEYGSPMVTADTFYIFRPYKWEGSEYIFTPNTYTVSVGRRSILAGGLSSLDEAIGYVVDDPGLLAEIDGGKFIPKGDYPYDIYGLQADMEDGDLSLITGDGFIAYAVQVEEDIVNRKILGIYQQANENIARSLAAEGITTAKGYSQIRERDAWLAEQSDAQAGRVLRDRNGNWVRVQQYVLRPDTKTVQILSASLRDVDGTAELSTLDFTTTFYTEYGLDADLRNLPWNSWLNTRTLNWGRCDNKVALKYVYTTSGAPLLESMTVTLQNPAYETFQESRTFAGELFNDWTKQLVTSELLNVNDELLYTNRYDAENLYTNVEYWTVGAYGGFSYQFADEVSPPIHVSLYELSGNASKRSGKTYDDIWDTLRVNEDSCHNIGDSALEIVVTDGAEAEAKRFNEFDVVYIPMSRMIWQEKEDGAKS